VRGPTCLARSTASILIFAIVHDDHTTTIFLPSTAMLPLLVYSFTLFQAANAQYVIPPELYSPIISQKLLQTAQNLPNPMAYPQWTKIAPYDGQEGKWQFFPTDTWTSGFFPASLMLLNERGRLCPNGQLISQADSASSLDQGRRWSVPLTTLEQVSF
jgi:hypothetical protein